MGVNRGSILALLAAFVLSSCEKWGTIEEAEQLYRNNHIHFHEIYKIVSSDKKLKDIHPSGDPYEGTEFIPKYGEFSEETKAVYLALLKRMKPLGIRRIRIDRFTSSQGFDIEFVHFVVFGRGFGGSTEAIVISRKKGNQPIADFVSPSTVCKQIDGPEWYVCHNK